MNNKKVNMDNLLLFHEQFSVERSKIIIKIENVEIEHKPETEEKFIEIDTSELLGRKDRELNYNEPPEPKFSKEILTERQPISEKIINTEDEPKFDKLLTTEVEAKEDKEIITDIEEKTERLTNTERQIKLDKLLFTDPEPTFDKDILTELEERTERLINTEAEQMEEKLINTEDELRFHKLLITENQPTIDKEIVTEKETKETKLINTDNDEYNELLNNRLSYVMEPDSLVITLNKNLYNINPEVVKLTKIITGDESENFVYKLVQQEEEEVHNPLLEEYEASDDGRASSLSSDEFLVNTGGFSKLHPDDPKTVLTWNVCGLAQAIAKEKLWESFVMVTRQHNPDIVILQDVKLCSSPLFGKVERLKVVTPGGYVVPNKQQENHDYDLVQNINKKYFKNYNLIHSLSSWRIGGQIIFIKNHFKILKTRYNLNIKKNAKYHHHEGRCIILQFESFYLLSLLSPIQGWINRSVKKKDYWDRELAVFLNNSKSEKATIITGNLNCAPEDIDLSDPARLKLEKSVELHSQDVIGYPGSRDIDREGFKWILNAGNLMDVFRFKHPYTSEASKKKSIKFTTLAYLSDKTKAAIRTNLVLMSRNFLNNVKLCEIIGNTDDLDPAGWRHLPQLLRLE